jgi:hypothetical protein
VVGVEWPMKIISIFWNVSLLTLLGALAPVLVVVPFFYYFFNVWRELKVIEWTALGP